MLISFLVACIGGVTDAPTDLGSTDPVNVRPLPGTTITCPEGTNEQTATSSKGEERWCDRAGVMHGPYIRLYPNGERAVKGEYDNSVPNSDWVWWHENGKEMSKGKYIKGKQTGPWTWWHDNGVRAEEGDFLGGRKAGQWVKYFESGRKQEEGLFHNDMKNGTWTYYVDDDEGTVERTERWEGGKMVEETILVGDNKDKGVKPQPKEKKDR
ncbi:MAG: hypothetical protein H6738_08435 [Alphaproteobacteria bacterium]|nr:hypothetical protein [Alphaproteobacteria bacterium]MCB9696788.1 hypothetical protein [Alphaproteobacteria bacterium]